MLLVLTYKEIDNVPAQHFTPGLVHTQVALGLGLTSCELLSLQTAIVPPLGEGVESYAEKAPVCSCTYTCERCVSREVNK